MAITPSAAQKEVDVSAWRERMLVPVLISIGMVVAIISSVGAPMVPMAATEYRISVGVAQWALTIALLTGGVVTPMLGRLGDGRYRREVILGALCFVTLGGIVAAIPSSFALLLVGRGLQGTGVGMLPMAMAVARDHVRAERSPAVVALLSVTSAAGVGLGYPISGWLSETVGFHPTFVFAAVIAGLALVGAAYAIPSSSHRAHRPLDLGGGAVLAIGVSAIVVALSEATAWGGGSVAFLGLVAVGVVTLVGWVYHQLHVTHPVVNLRTLARPSVRVAQSTALLAGVGLYFLLSLVVRYVETPRSTGYGLGRSVLVTGLLLVPFSAASLVVNRALPLLRRWPGSHWLLSSGSFAFIASMGFFVFARSSLWELCITLALAGLGLGMCYASMPQLIVAAVPAHETGSALGFNQVLRIIGGAIGSATSAAVLAASTKSGSKFPLDIGYTRAAYVALGVWVVTLILSWPRRSLILVSVEHLIEEESVDAAVAGAIIYEPDVD